jgi:tripartite ATP-independent transporter DctM subunit
MAEVSIGPVAVLAVVLLVYAGLHVAVALAATSLVAVWVLKGNPVVATKLLAQAASEGISDYIFGVVPLFILMGLLVSKANVGRDAFDLANAAFRRVLGGLGVATVGANAVFAAITGISIASAAVFTKVAVPEMLRAGYHTRFAVGVVAGSSVLGMLIPPSLLFIIYGVLAEVSIGKLFLAGVMPGLLLAVVYSVAIVAGARWRPGWVFQRAPVGAGALVLPALPALPDLPALTGRGAAAKAAPILLLVGVVLGGIYGGVFTPTEAGAVGTAAALLLALARRSLDLKSFTQLVGETGQITASICLLFIAAVTFSRMLALTGVPNLLSHWIAGAGLSMHEVLAIYIVVVVLLGMILDSNSIMLIAVPIAVPIMLPMGVDLVWLGVVTVIAVEIGLLTPPFGLSVYVIKATLGRQDVSLTDIFMGALPFAFLMLIVLLAVIAFPWLATGLL